MCVWEGEGGGGRVMWACMCSIQYMRVYLMEGLGMSKAMYIEESACVFLLQADRDPEGPVDRERARTDAQVFSESSLSRHNRNLYVCYRRKYFSKALILLVNIL